MLIKFRATSIWKAFLLNSFVVSLIAVVAVETHRQLDKTEVRVSETAKGFISFLATFLVAIIVYLLMYFLFNYGGGMLATKKTVPFL